MPERTPWHDRLFPELQRLDQPARAKALRAANRRVWRNWRTWLFFVLYVGAIAAAVMLAYPFTRRLPVPSLALRARTGSVHAFWPSSLHAFPPSCFLPFPPSHVPTPPPRE
jgi:hypothetical protein